MFLRIIQNAPRDYGFSIGSGVPVNCINASIAASYEVRENIYIDASMMYRNYSVSNPVAAGVQSSNSAIFSIGIRLNTFRRQYDY
jgi:hypothetical protein